MRLATRFARLLEVALLTASAAALVPATANAVLPRATFGARGTIARVVLTQQTAVDVRGRPVAAFAQSFDGSLRFVVSRWTADGRVDGAFGDASGGSGTVQLLPDVPLLSVISTRVAGTPDGGLAVAASLQVQDGVRVAILRLDDAGTPVAGFGSGGVALAGDGELTADPVAQADGGVLLAQGTAVRRLTAAGTPDPAFGTGGTAVLPGEVTALALAGDRVLAAMPGVRVATLTAAGVPDGPVQSIGAPESAIVLELRAVADRIVLRGIVRLSREGSPPGAPVDRGFVGQLDTRDFFIVPFGAAAIDPRDGSTITVTRSGRVRGYAVDGVADPRLRVTLPPTPGNVRFLPQVVGLGPDGQIVIGGTASGTILPTAAFAAVRDHRLDRSFGGSTLLKLRGQSVRLEGRVVAVRVHCAGDAQRRCVVRASGGSSTVRAFVAPGGDRKVRVPVSRSLTRAVRRAGRREVRLRLSVIDEAQRVQEESVSLVVRR